MTRRWFGRWKCLACTLMMACAGIAPAWAFADEGTWWVDHSKIVYEKAIVGGALNGSPPDSPSNRIDPNTKSSTFAGVGSIQITYSGSNYICTGTAISRWHVVTAAHCVDFNNNGQSNVAPSAVRFRLNFGGNTTHNIQSSAIAVHPDYTGFNNPNVHDDLVVLTLSQPLPADLPIYPLYRELVQNNDRFMMVGYGRSGDGVNGYTTGPDYTIKRTGENLAQNFSNDDEGSGQREVFRFDFDGPTGNGFYAGGTLGNDIEATLGGGDSGGPSFIDHHGQYHQAAANTFGFASGGNAMGTFGSGGGGILLHPYLPWIDSITDPDGVFWLDDVSGNIASASAWRGGVAPDPTRHAIFTVTNAPYTVSLTANRTHNRLSVRQGDVTLALGGQTYQLTGSGGWTPGLTVWEYAGQSSLTVTGGQLVGVDAVVGAGPGGSATLRFTGGSTTWSASGSVHLGGTSLDPSPGVGRLELINNAAAGIAGTLRIRQTGQLVLDSGATLSANTIQHTDGGSFQFLGGQLAVGTFQGNLVQQGGTLSPALSAAAGTTQINGSYTLTAGTVQVNLNGLTPGSQHDRINITGSASLSGTLDIVLGFDPVSAATFDILTAASVTGGFATVTGDRVLGYKPLIVAMQPGAVRLIVATPGDATLDNTVGLADLTIVADNWQQSVSLWEQGDFNGDGIVDEFDLALLAVHWQFGMSQQMSFAEAIASVTFAPEPGTLAVLLLGLLGVHRRPRRA